MRFLIRDDDTNYFTKPDYLTECYQDIWQHCPISLAVVPFHACTKSGAIPPEYWQPAGQNSNRLFPIGENQGLVKFLKEKIQRGQVTVALHGYSHQDVRPQPGGYEFEAGEDLDLKVQVGKRYLEKVFGVPIRIFVPPHNALSASGAAAIFKHGLSLSGTLGRRAWRYGPVVWRNLFIRKWWQQWQRGPYPYPQRYGANWALGFQSLTPLVSLPSLQNALEHYRRWDGWFCLATHHWEFGARQRTGEQMSLGEVFRSFWDAVKKVSDLTFVSLNDLIPPSAGAELSHEGD